MKNLNQTIKVAANRSAKTFTIRTYFNGKLTAKYRTIKLSKDEFENLEYNTEGDWKEFLKSDSYYVVK